MIEAGQTKVAGLLQAGPAVAGLLTAVNMTHEEFVHSVRAEVIKRATPEIAAKLQSVKLVYGAGIAGTRGVTFFQAWKNGSVDDLVEICAGCEEHPVQLAGTTVHELGHVLAGPGAGHGKAWKAACATLGLMNAQAAGQSYEWETFENDLRSSLQNIPLPTDGTPNLGASQGAPAGLIKKLTTPRPCSMGRGSRGGKSFGAGSGSRLRLYECKCEPKPVKVRVASDDFDATCNVCGSKFERK